MSTIKFDEIKIYYYYYVFSHLPANETITPEDDAWFLMS